VTRRHQSPRQFGTRTLRDPPDARCAGSCFSTRLAVSVGDTHLDVRGGYPVPDLLLVVPKTTKPAR
jgi:hypothetical protein